MEKPRVYIETTIPSAYFDARPDPAMVARRDATRRWWATAGERYELVTSLAVEEELRSGPSRWRKEWLALISTLPRLKTGSAVMEIVGVYLRHKLMPLNDAMHLASASAHECDYLLTWDFKHLANPNKFGHIQRVSERQRLFVPRIVTPLQLPGGRHEAG